MKVHDNLPSALEKIPAPAVDTARALPVEKTPALYKDHSADSTSSLAQQALQNQSPESLGTKEDLGLSPGPRTVGEKIFDRRTYERWGLWFTLVASVAVAWLFKNSEAKVPFRDESFKDMWKGWVDGYANKSWVKGLAESPIGKVLCGVLPKEKADPKLMAENMLMTSALMMGGNIAIIPIKFRESHKKELVQQYNQEFGDAHDVAQGNANVNAEAKQSWGSLLLGRAAAWAVVFTSLTAANIGIRWAAGSLENNGYGNFSTAKKDGLGGFSNWVGKKMGNMLSWAPGGNKLWQQIGNIFAVDIFATVAAENILKYGSRAISSAGHKPEKEILPIRPTPVLHKGESAEDIKTTSLAISFSKKHIKNDDHQSRVRAQASASLEMAP